MTLDTLSPHELALELMGHHQATLEDVRRIHGDLRDHLGAVREPARITAVQLDATHLSRDFPEPVDAPSLSVGVYNPTGLLVYLGLTGSATSEGLGLPVPPKSLLVMPVAANEPAVGVDPTDTASIGTLGTSTAVVFLLRWTSVQPAFFSAETT